MAVIWAAVIGYFFVPEIFKAVPGKIDQALGSMDEEDPEYFRYPIDSDLCYTIARNTGLGAQMVFIEHDCSKKINFPAQAGWVTVTAQGSIPAF